ncbi:unnamed protein product [Arctia plantaginis]|uniref:SOCS box domain-containing protein n=1 Tax=Arctia plantaginis TaxID=874455 RepID=A0A8S1AV43_ARCPL|nr:unnamed protein product [Arctia plantaginis]
MDLHLEDTLYQAILAENYDTISQVLSKGANPNKTVKQGKTCLGEAASMGNVDILKILLSVNQTSSTQKVSPYNVTTRKRHIKCHKRKLKHYGRHEETVVKCKNHNDRTLKDYKFGHYDMMEIIDNNGKTDKNQGYFVFIHSEGSSSDESKIGSLKSPLSPTLLTPSPQADLEWDEEIGNVAPTTSEDETWSSMYKWYAAILESTGAAIASASVVSNGIDQQDAFMRTALHYASEQNHLNAVKLLIEAGCKVDIAAGDGLTPLHVAVVKNHIEIVKVLLKAGSQVNYKTHEKMIPLHFAAARGFLEAVKILVDGGASLEARDTNERTALYLAVVRGHVNVVKYLISIGANVNGEEIHGYTPLCEAVWARSSVLIEILLKAGARITHSHRLLHNAIIQRQGEIVKLLTNFGGGINLHNDNGDTPLLLAARSCQPEIVTILLSKGANVNSRNSITGENALHIAVESVYCSKVFEELLKLLLNNKIDMNAAALTGDTALNRALLLHKDKAAVLLIRYGINVNNCGVHKCGWDNLSIATRRRSYSLASMLLKAGHYVLTPGPSCSTVHWLNFVCVQPLTLRDICRIKVRYIGRHAVLYRFIESLPLPKSLKGFLMMEDEGL